MESAFEVHQSDIDTAADLHEAPDLLPVLQGDGRHCISGGKVGAGLEERRPNLLYGHLAAGSGQVRPYRASGPRNHVARSALSLVVKELATSCDVAGYDRFRGGPVSRFQHRGKSVEFI